QALWLYQGLDAPAIDLLRVLLADNEFRVRAAAARVLSNWADPNMRPNQLLASAEALDLFATLVADEHPRVRLEAVHGLSRLGSLEAAQLAMQVLERPVDRFVEHALGLAVDQLGPTIMAAIENGDWRLDSELGQRQLEFVLTAVRPELATTFLQRELQASALDRQGSGPWIELIAQAGGAAELQQLFDRACNDGFEQAATVRAIRALTDAQRLRRVRPSRDLSRIEALFSSPATDVRDAAITLAGVWKLNRQAAGLLSIAVDSQSQMSTRQAAAEALRAIGVTSIADRLVSGIEHVDAPQLRLALLLALADSQPDRAAAPLVELLSKMPSEQEALAPWRAALSIQGFGKRLASHVSASNLSEWVLQAGVRACRDGGRNEPELLDALAQMVQTSSAEPITRERILELAALASDGDAERGELIYRRSQLACATCHAIGGVGGRVGPDISSLGASAPIDYIVESLFLPDAKIKEGF
ncbi:MAG: HEAT repeat domain-containing protein, partial [Planctomycetales bacterium]|nr:HEAT repeat domain-containing protein [Planctomycetales bacterium]